MFEYFAQSNAVDAIWYTDDIAFIGGLLVSPETLHEYFFPWLRRIGELARKYNKPLLYHTDGVLWDVFDEIVACGVDGLHPIEPKAMDIVEVKTRYGQELCLLGNVDVDILSRGTTDQIRSIVKHNIESVGADGGYCVGSGNSIPEYVKYENYLALLSATREFGGG
jgi:uroporphyrinogen decarboxylase